MTRMYRGFFLDLFGFNSSCGIPERKTTAFLALFNPLV
jgi:hypothetical protein